MFLSDVSLMKVLESYRGIMCVIHPDIPNYPVSLIKDWCHWPHGLRRRSVASRLPRLWVGICVELITNPEEAYRVRFFVVCDLVTSKMRRPWPELCRSASGGNLSKILAIKNRVAEILRQLFTYSQMAPLSKRNSVLLNFSFFSKPIQRCLVSCFKVNRILVHDFFFPEFYERPVEFSETMMLWLIEYYKVM